MKALSSLGIGTLNQRIKKHMINTPTPTEIKKYNNNNNNNNNKKYN